MNAVAITGAGVLVPEGGPAIADISPERHLKDRKAIKYMDRLSMMAVRAAGDALVDAGLKLDELDPHAVGLSMAVGHVAADVSDFQPVIAAGRAADGSFDAAALGRSNRINPIAVFKTLSNIPVCNVSIALGIKGDNLILYPDAPQTARALEEGAWAIREGTARVVLAGGVASGVDFLNVQRRAMFARAAGDPARPPAADGSVVLVLEDEAAARARGARVRGRVRGLAEAGGSAEPYLGAPTAESVAAAVRGALAAAGARVGEVTRVIGGAMIHAHRAAERDGLALADLTAPIEYPADATGDMSTASFAYGVKLALDGRGLTLVLGAGHQGDVACVAVEAA